MSYSIKVIFGTEQVNRYLEGFSLSEEEETIHSKEYHFETEAETKAFEKGINEAVGWNEACCIVNELLVGANCA